MAKNPNPKSGTTTEPTPAAPPAAPLATFEEVHAGVIREKVSAGLSRDQAIEVVRAQLAHDAALAAAAKK